MESNKTRDKSQKTPPKKEVSLFWDYENVPVPKKRRSNFLLALHNFFLLHPPARACIYSHKEALSPDILREIRWVGPLRANFISETGANVTDKVMMQSARDTLRTRPNLPYLVLITGDGDFRVLLREMRPGTGHILLICGLTNHNQQFYGESCDIFSSHYLASNPDDWWEGPTRGQDLYVCKPERSFEVLPQLRE